MSDFPDELPFEMDLAETNWSSIPQEPSIKEKITNPRWLNVIYDHALNESKRKGMKISAGEIRAARVFLREDHSVELVMASGEYIILERETENNKQRDTYEM